MNDNPKPGKNGFKFPEHSIKTKITDVKPNELVTRGYNQEDLITNLSFAEMVFLLLRERLPDERESKIFNHILVSFCDHGVTPPSTQSARLIASSGANINNAVAGIMLLQEDCCPLVKIMLELLKRLWNYSRNQSAH